MTTERPPERARALLHAPGSLQHHCARASYVQRDKRRKKETRTIGEVTWVNGIEVWLKGQDRGQKGPSGGGRVALWLTS